MSPYISGEKSNRWDFVAEAEEPLGFYWISGPLEWQVRKLAVCVCRKWERLTHRLQSLHRLVVEFLFVTPGVKSGTMWTKQRKNGLSWKRLKMESSGMWQILKHTNLHWHMSCHVQKHSLLTHLLLGSVLRTSAACLMSWSSAVWVLTLLLRETHLPLPPVLHPSGPSVNMKDCGYRGALPVVAANSTVRLWLCIWTKIHSSSTWIIYVITLLLSPLLRNILEESSVWVGS